MKLGFYTVFGWLIINPLSDCHRHFEFSKSDNGFVISIPENPHIEIFIKIENFSKFRSVILNFEILTSNSKSATQKPTVAKCSLDFHVNKRFSKFWAAILELPFRISKIWQQIRNQHPRKSLYTNFHKNWKFFEIPFRHIGSTIFNFENRTTYSKSVIQKSSVYKFSWKLNDFRNFGPQYWNRHFEFRKSDNGFEISDLENPKIPTFEWIWFIV